MPNPGMYRGDRRRKEDQRKAKLEAKRARKAERRGRRRLQRLDRLEGPYYADDPQRLIRRSLAPLGDLSPPLGSPSAAPRPAT